MIFTAVTHLTPIYSAKSATIALLLGLLAQDG